MCGWLLRWRFRLFFVNPSANFGVHANVRRYEYASTNGFFRIHAVRSFEHCVSDGVLNLNELDTDDDGSIDNYNDMQRTEYTELVAAVARTTLSYHVVSNVNELPSCRRAADAQCTRTLFHMGSDLFCGASRASSAAKRNVSVCAVH